MRNSESRIRSSLIAVGLMATPLAAGADRPEVTITGGADASGRQYTWTITNGYTSPIVYLEIPHYRAGLFFAPEGWATGESTYLVNVGVEDRPGVCIARAAAVTDGIASGQSATFDVQIGARGARRGPGTVLVRFADGTETTVSGVELPRQETLGDKYVTLIGLGLIFAVGLLIQAIRARRRSTACGSTTAPPSGQT